LFYKVRIEGDPEHYYLACSGPYDIDPLKLAVSADTGVNTGADEMKGISVYRNFDEAYDPQHADDLVRGLLENYK
jgi:hypothetical protein